MHPSITKQLVEEHHNRLHADATPSAARLVAGHARQGTSQAKRRDKVGAVLIRWGTRLSTQPSRGGAETWTTCGATSK